MFMTSNSNMSDNYFHRIVWFCFSLCGPILQTERKSLVLLQKEGNRKYFYLLLFLYYKLCRIFHMIFLEFAYVQMMFSNISCDFLDLCMMITLHLHSSFTCPYQVVTLTLFNASLKKNTESIDSFPVVNVHCSFFSKAFEKV